MRFLSVTILCLLSASIMMSSCAKKSNENQLAITKQAWLGWMEKTYGSDPMIKPLGNEGLFMKTITPATGTDDVKTNNWVRINYTGETIYGNVYATRNEDVAKMQGTWTVYTHYVPQYVKIPETFIYSGMCKGQYDAIKAMREGQQVEIYVPSYLGYGPSGASFNKGYQGQTQLGAGAHLKIKLELVEIIEDIDMHEKAAVVGYANNIGLSDPAKDTVKTNLFVARDIYPFIAPPAAEIALRDSITVDSTVHIYYVGEFLDGFVFSTNIDSVMTRVWPDVTHSSESKKAKEYTPKNGEMIDAFYHVVPTMVYDQWVQMVFTSNYGYGAQGKADGNTVIQPYSPLTFRFYVKSNKKE